MKSRQGSIVKKGLKFFIYGEQGTWKSSLALEFMKMKREDGKPMRVVYVDTEFGSIDNYLEDLENEGINLDNLFIVYTNEYNQVEEFLEKVINDEDLYTEDDDGNEVLVLDADGEKFIADAIVLDSATVLQDTVKYSMILTSEKRARLRVNKKENATAAEKFVAEATAGMEFKDYDKLQQKGKNLLRNLITRTDKYVVVTSREKDKKEDRKVNDEWKSVKVGVMPDCFKGAEYEFFTVLRTFEDLEDGMIKAEVERKDRTKMFQQGEIIEEPSLLLWQPVINKNATKKKSITMDKSYDDNVQSEADNLYKKDNKDDVNTKGNKEEPVEIDLTNKSMIIAEIVRLRSKMTPVNKRNLPINFQKADLPKQPNANLELDDLVKMLEIAQGM